MFLKKSLRKKPKIVKHLKWRRIHQQQHFKFSITRAFGPKDGSLRFSLTEKSPSWLRIDPITGLVTGETPKVTQDTKFLVGITASNNYGKITARFKIIVIFSDMKFTVTRRMFLWFNEDTLEDIPGMVDTEAFDEAFFKELDDYIRKTKDVTLINKIVDAFRKAVGLKTVAPMSFQDYIANRDRANTKTGFDMIHDAVHLLQNTEDFQRAFRQGSQQQGAIIVPIFNPHGIARYQVWIGNAGDPMSDTFHSEMEKQISAQRSFRHSITRGDK